MIPHPADVARIFSTYPFFKAFSEDLLLQLATMVELVVFQKGQVILREGQTNNNLYFLKEGSIEILLADVNVSELKAPGEVFGEMSVVTGQPVATTARASTTVECFVLNSDHLNHVYPKDKDRLSGLLYRVYSIILADRLKKTNEKARLFEIANREMHEAQVRLESLGDRNVLLVKGDKTQLMLAKMAVGGTGVKMDTASDLAMAEKLLTTNQYDALICDETCINLMKDAKNRNLAKSFVLVTAKNARIDLMTLGNMLFIDNVISIDAQNRTETVRSILTTLTKVLTKDLFGLEKYLNWGVDCQSRMVKSSTEREGLREGMIEYFRNMGVRNTFLERVNAVAEEMLMNAIYDAPVDSSGASLFNHYSRRDSVLLESQFQGQLRYACDGVVLAISVVDPFGSLTKEVLVKYLRSCYEGKAGIYNESNPEKGGAGRGLHQIIENSDLTVFNIKKGIRTEVISLFHIEGGPKDIQPSFNYFFV